MVRVSQQIEAAPRSALTVQKQGVMDASDGSAHQILFVQDPRELSHLNLPNISLHSV